ncbi:alcohol dehydrogenase catalytic domain-containing protein, partial [Pseudomonas viridiflava]|uniref:alcohol dehydrogenase catalytic domain-containing protein n=1 Tax=Pseudomonas viridiflava TaxID=33069 RepID=UPI001F071B29
MEVSDDQAILLSDIFPTGYFGAEMAEITDAIIRITASAICGTDLHFVRGTFSGMVKGTILGHEAVGIVEELGSDVRNLQIGDRVVVPSTIACGNCSYCRAGYYA